MNRLGNGRMEDWNNGRLGRWNIGKMENQKTVGMEKWVNGNNERGYLNKILKINISNF